MWEFVRKNSALLKASVGTNFVYQLTERESSMLNLEAANRGSKIAERIQFVREQGHVLEFVRVESGELFGNLQLIDSELPRIIAYLVEYMYAGDAGADVVGLLEHLKLENPLEFDMSEGHPFYEHKVKRFLVALALGMNAAEVWNGEPNLVDRIVEVKDGDQTVLYTVYDYQRFEAELVNETRLEGASRTRYGFGDWYREGERVYIKLNLQIRFA